MRVSTTNFQNAFGKYLKEVSDGNEVIVTKNGKGVAKLVRYEDPNYYVLKEETSEYYVKKRVSYEEFLEITENSEARYELIDGEIFLMASPNYKHQLVIKEMFGQMYIYFNGKDCTPLTAPFDVKLFDAKSTFEDDPNVVQPDILVVCDHENINEQGRYNGKPTIVMEILSPSTRRWDMVTKLNLYMRSGIPEYWIVDTELRKVYVYLFEELDIKNYNVYEFDDSIEVKQFNGLTINLSTIK